MEPLLEDFNIKNIKAEPEPSGSGSEVEDGTHMVKADLGNESNDIGDATDGDNNGYFGAEGEFEGFGQYGESKTLEKSRDLCLNAESS